MNEGFLGRSDSFWIGLQAIGALSSALVLLITGWFIYRQLRTAVRSFQFDGILKMQEIIDAFREERNKIYTTFPLDLVMKSTQFPRTPPSRIKRFNISKQSKRKMRLTKHQMKALHGLSEEQIKLARYVIGKLNDLGQLVEDGFVDRRVFLGKYHTMIIRLCYLLEPVRRQEEERQGGNFGQRLLRLRHAAVRYNKLYPKHRKISIRIVTPNGSKTVISATDGGLIQRISWSFQRKIIWIFHILLSR